MNSWKPKSDKKYSLSQIIKECAENSYQYIDLEHFWWGALKQRVLLIFDFDKKRVKYTTTKSSYQEFLNNFQGNINNRNNLHYLPCSFLDLVKYSETPILEATGLDTGELSMVASSQMTFGKSQILFLEDFGQMVTTYDGRLTSVYNIANNQIIFTSREPQQCN